MKLGKTGEARVRGYLFVLGRSLKTFLPPDVAADSLREIESHIRERLAQAEAIPDEASAVESVLTELGPPLRVAQAYSAEMTVDEAVTTGRVGATARALWALATTNLGAFFAALGLFTGYVGGAAFIVTAALKPIVPGNVGLFVVDGVPHSFGAQFPAPVGAEVWGGYWVIPICLALGLAILVITHRCARRFLAWWGRRTRLASALPHSAGAAFGPPE
jgi:uncharacterized membrane protein